MSADRLIWNYEARGKALFPRSWFILGRRNGGSRQPREQAAAIKDAATSPAIEEDAARSDDSSPD